MKILRYLKKYWLAAMLAPIFMVFEVLMDLFQPRLMSKIVDEGVLGGNMHIIVVTGLTMLGLLIIGGIAGSLSSLAAGIASQSFSCDLRKDVYKRVMHLSFQQTDKFTTGSLVTRLSNDITQAQEFVAQALRMFVRSGIMFLGGIVMMLSLNVQFGKVIVCALPIQVVIIIFFLKKANPLFSRVQKRLDRVNSVMQENVSGSRVVKAYVREEYETERFGGANDGLMQINLKVHRLMAALMPFLMIIMNISVLAIIYIGGLEVRAQEIQVGQIMAAITYTTQIIMSMMMVAMVFQSVSRAKASIDRLNEVLDTVPVIKDGEGANAACESATELDNTVIEDGEGANAACEGEIEFDNVSFSYPGFEGRPVLSGISFAAKKGETVAILGATGSGKTSLVNLIPRFYDTTGGTVRVDGVDVRSYKLDELRKKIGFVLQKSELFSGTVADNIRWGDHDASDDEVIRAAKIAQADDFVSGFADGYKTIISEKGSSLSGGQKQRLSIARAIIKKPEILVFDDSTSALDLSTEARLHKSLRENLGDTTIIMIAQRVASVKNADKILVIENGVIAAEGTHDELIENSRVYQDIYNSQVKKEGTK